MVRECSISATAWSILLIRSASAGCLAAYASICGCSPRRRRAENSSANAASSSSLAVALAGELTPGSAVDSCDVLLMGATQLDPRACQQECPSNVQVLVCIAWPRPALGFP